MMSDSNSGDHEEEQQVVESELILDETYCRGGGGGEVGGERVSELKEMLLRKYSGYLATLRKDFLKKRKKGKLPKDARSALLDWWNTHLTWPYPTEEEKVKLSEITGLDQKQINNWFINQRKRHWKPSEEMRFALMEGTG
ncbi:hypothetical protein FNV43_RR03628 [Rhamnella rubrinervis]|uniref:Uncharacterized protein n=1 Tax=Rhamnella rubrinervis TaxID=2594499 RepID=A0A8K0HIT0_9ROSA|nr:hypothetical protein FNV43_RR03628 [Rhamnella rubrinervis]